jgi:hypothetical protein
MNRLSLWLLENTSATEEQLLTELRSIQTFASLKPADRIIIYLGAVFSEEMIPASQIITHKAFLATLAPTSIQQRHLIGNISFRHSLLLFELTVLPVIFFDIFLITYSKFI